VIVLPAPTVPDRPVEHGVVGLVPDLGFQRFLVGRIEHDVVLGEGHVHVDDSRSEIEHSHRLSELNPGQQQPQVLKRFRSLVQEREGFAHQDRSVRHAPEVRHPTSRSAVRRRSGA
jgi:hypothetical protein